MDHLRDQPKMTTETVDLRSLSSFDHVFVLPQMFSWTPCLTSYRMMTFLFHYRNEIDSLLILSHPPSFSPSLPRFNFDKKSSSDLEAAAFCNVQSGQIAISSVASIGFVYSLSLRRQMPYVIQKRLSHLAVLCAFTIHYRIRPLEVQDIYQFIGLTWS